MAAVDVDRRLRERAPGRAGAGSAHCRVGHHGAGRVRRRLAARRGPADRRRAAARAGGRARTAPATSTPGCCCGGTARRATSASAAPARATSGCTPTCRSAAVDERERGPPARAWWSRARWRCASRRGGWRGERSRRTVARRGRCTRVAPVAHWWGRSGGQIASHKGRHRPSPPEPPCGRSTLRRRCALRRQLLLDPPQKHAVRNGRSTRRVTLRAATLDRKSRGRYAVRRPLAEGAVVGAVGPHAGRQRGVPARLRPAAGLLEGAAEAEVREVVDRRSARRPPRTPRARAAKRPERKYARPSASRIEVLSGSSARACSSGIAAAAKSPASSSSLPRRYRS